jgi:hypothetical protein
VALVPSPRPGFVVTSVVLITAGLAYARATRRSLHEQASRLMLGDQAPAIDQSLPHALLIEAERLASLGAYRMAIVVAENAVEIALRRAGATQTPAAAEWSKFDDVVATVKADDDQPEGDLVVAVLGAAELVVDEHTASMRRRRRKLRRSQ